MSKPKSQLTSVGAMAAVAGIVCFVAAVGFGLESTIATRDGKLANIASAGAACGFGIACG